MTAHANEKTGGEKADKLLLVDDNPTNLQVLAQTLNGRGYELLVAMNGEMALSAARKANPALILLDIMMPDIDGYEVCRRLKQDPATQDISVIFLSALDETKDKVRGLDVGAVDYISKPFKADEVIARVETHLTNHRLRQSLARRNQELEAANQRMRRDLEAATRLQQSLLPEVGPASTHARFAWRYLPCDELAGDSLNVFTIDERHIGMYVIDVSGHGVSAALLSVAVTRSLSPHTERSSIIVEPNDQEDAGFSIVSPPRVAQRLNRIYPMDANGMHYFTLVYGLLDTETGTFRYVCAGHPGPIRLRRDAEAEVFDAPAVPVGIMEESEYEESVLQLQPGDRLYLYSDGLNEQRNRQGEEFGLTRVKRILQDTHARDLDQAVDAVLDNAEQWRRGAHFDDDVTIVAVELTGA